MTSTHRLTSVYTAIQDGGEHANKAIVWVKLFGCNLQCQGFGQKNLGDSDTWDRPWKTINVTQYKHMSEAPLFRTGCDSIHSWNEKFEGLARNLTAQNICDEIQDALTSIHNTEGAFLHPGSLHEARLGFTGGEPMMQQAAIRDILVELSARKNAPRYVLVETNGTIPVESETHDLINAFYMKSEFDGLVPDERGRPAWVWSVSPKIRTSGEKPSDAVNFEVIEGYNRINDAGYLTFAIDGEDNTWYEIGLIIEKLRSMGIFWPVNVTTVGSWLEDIELLQRKVRKQAIERGYYFIPRTNAMISGDTIDR